METRNVNILDLVRYSQHDFKRDVAEMKESIRRCGLLYSILAVRLPEDGHYRIVDGELRFEALKELYEEEPDKYAKVPVSVLGNDEMEPAERMLVVAAANRTSCTAKHLFYMFDLLANTGLQSERWSAEICAVVHLTKRQIRKYLNVYRNGSQELKQLLLRNGISVTKAEKLSRKPVEEQLP